MADPNFRDSPTLDLSAAFDVDSFAYLGDKHRLADFSTPNPYSALDDHIQPELNDVDHRDLNDIDSKLQDDDPNSSLFDSFSSGGILFGQKAPTSLPTLSDGAGLPSASKAKKQSSKRHSSAIEDNPLIVGVSFFAQGASPSPSSGPLTHPTPASAGSSKSQPKRKRVKASSSSSKSASGPKSQGKASNQQRSLPPAAKTNKPKAKRGTQANAGYPPQLRVSHSSVPQDLSVPLTPQTLSPHPLCLVSFLRFDSSSGQVCGFTRVGDTPTDWFPAMNVSQILGNIKTWAPLPLTFGPILPLTFGYPAPLASGPSVVRAQLMYKRESAGDAANLRSYRNLWQLLKGHLGDRNKIAVFVLLEYSSSQGRDEDKQLAEASCGPERTQFTPRGTVSTVKLLRFICSGNAPSFEGFPPSLLQGAIDHQIQQIRAASVLSLGLSAMPSLRPSSQLPVLTFPQSSSPLIVPPPPPPPPNPPVTTLSQDLGSVFPSLDSAAFDLYMSQPAPVGSAQLSPSSSATEVAYPAVRSDLSMAIAASSVMKDEAGAMSVGPLPITELDGSQNVDAFVHQ